MHLGPRGAAELQTHPSLNAIAIVPSGWMAAWSTRARQASGVDFVHHCVACGDRLGELGLEGVRITELVEGGFEYLGAGWWCELAGGLLERGDQLVFGYVLGCAWLVAGGIVFAVAPPDAPLVAAARREAP